MRQTAVLTYFLILLVNILLLAGGTGYAIALSDCCTQRTAVGLPIFFIMVGTVGAWHLCRGLRARGQRSALLTPVDN